MASARNGHATEPKGLKPFAFLKPLIETDPNDRRRYADDDHAVAEHDRNQRSRAGDDDQPKTDGMRPKPKPLSTRKKRPAKRGATRAAKA
jgi:hypothetical protein